MTASLLPAMSDLICRIYGVTLRTPTSLRGHLNPHTRFRMAGVQYCTGFERTNKGLTMKVEGEEKMQERPDDGLGLHI